ncbi:MAG TPA: AraC family transcriptional regulator [Ruminiclostridium sp.]
MKLRDLLRQRTYLTKIYLWITSVVVLIITVFSTIVYFNVQNSVLDNEYKNAQKVLYQMKYNIDFVDKSINTICVSTYYDQDIKSLMNTNGEITFDLMETLNKLNNTTVQSNSFIQSIYIYNNNKKAYYSTYKSFSYEDEELKSLIKSMKDIPILKPIVRKCETYDLGNSKIYYNNVLTYFMYELKDSSNNMYGAVIVNIKLDWLFDNINTINSIDGNKQGKIFILDNEDKYIQANLNTKPEDTEFQQSLKKAYNFQKSKEIDSATSKAGFFKAKVAGEDYLVTYTSVSNSGWTLLKTQPYDSVFEYINKLKTTIIIITAIIILLTFVATFTISRGIYRPLKKLLGQVILESGNTAMGNKNRDEFSYLQEIYKNSFDQLNKYKEDKNSNERIMKIYFLKKLLFDSYTVTNPEYEDFKAEYGLLVDLDKSYVVCVLKLDNYKEIEAINDAKSRDLLKFAIINITSEVVSKSFMNEMIDMKSDEIAMIINADANETFYDQLDILLKEAQKYIFQYYQVSLTASISNKMMDLKNVAGAYNDALSNVLYRFVFGKQAIIKPEMLKKNNYNAQFEYSSEAERKLFENIKRGDLEGSNEKLLFLLSEIRDFEYNNIMLCLSRLVNAIKNIIYEMNRSRTEPININIIFSSREIFEIETLEEFSMKTMEILKQILIPSETSLNKNHLMTAETIKEIIETNYYDFNLSASGIASILKMSPSTIGKIFKENVMMSIPEYIGNYRLNKAVQWMENSNMSINEIIIKVGIENESYFYKIFKAKYGTTPREYVSKRQTI